MDYNQRLDTLRFGKPHQKLLFRSGIGWALDAMDVGLISYIMAALAAEWGLTKGQLSGLASAGFIGMMIGATLGGLLADKIGRRSVFALTLLIYGIATGASAFAGGLAVLIVLRFIVGVGLGAELPVASTLVSEFSPRHIRGRMVVALESFWALGWIGAALLGYFVVPHTFANWPGWRWALLVGIVPAAYALVVRRGLPESVRYLVDKGRLKEAEAAVAHFEDSNAVHTSDARDVTTPTAPATTTATTAEEQATSIFAPALRARTAGLWSIWFFLNLAYYGAFIWLPTLLVLQGHGLVKSFEYTLIITLAQLPGYAVAAWLIEVWGRKATLATFLAGSALAAAFFGMQHSPTGIIIAGCLLSFFNLGAWGALYAIGPELYPTHIRGTGTGSAAAVGRVAGILAPFMVPLIPGTGALFAVFGLAFAIAAASTFALPEQRNQTLLG